MPVPWIAIVIATRRPPHISLVERDYVMSITPSRARPHLCG